MPRMTRKYQRGMVQGSRRGGWKAARKSLTTDERRVNRIMKKATEDKKPDKLKRYQSLIMNSTEESEQLKYIGKAVELSYGFNAKPEQLEALRWLLFEKRDLLLVAKTSFGKSVILQLFPCLTPDAIALILLPLNAIGAEQLKKIQTLPGARPIHLNAQNNNAQALADIRNGFYTHILLSPEIACSRKFRESVLSNQKFRERVKAVIVDEVHLVVDWGQTFRESYTHLRYLRDVVGEKPWFGCTATLDKSTFKALCYSSGFSRDVRIMRTTVNRPEISIIRKELPRRTKSSYRMLYFLLDNSAEFEEADRPWPTPQQIKKAVVFFDTKREMHSCLETLRTWLEDKKGYSTAEANITVVEYHATLGDKDKKRIYDEFKKPDSRIRILVATEALALGCDVPDIEIGVQYALPRGWNINTVFQRFGRCARRAGLKALAVFFVESRFIGPKKASTPRKSNQEISRSGGGTSKTADPNESGDSDGEFEIYSDVDELPHVPGRVETEVTSEGDVHTTADMNIAAPRRKKSPKSDFEIRAQLPGVLYDFCNSKGCLRKIILGHYLEEIGGQEADPCCSNCQPHLAELAEFELEKKKRKHFLTGSRRHPIFQLLRGWCCKWVKDKWPKGSFYPDSRVFISDDELMTICDKAWLMSSVEAILEHLVDWKWGLEALDSLREALYRARGAARDADTVGHIKQCLSDWPWQYVQISELSEALSNCKACPGDRPAKRQRTRQRNKCDSTTAGGGISHI